MVDEGQVVQGNSRGPNASRAGIVAVFRKVALFGRGVLGQHLAAGVTHGARLIPAVLERGISRFGL
jgi:hypothetical protein